MNSQVFYSELNKKFPDFLVAIGLKKKANYADSIIACDADKCYQYFEVWKKHGISEVKGTMLYLITKEHPYNQEARVTVSPMDWVINHYNDFVEVFKKLEIS